MIEEERRFVQSLRHESNPQRMRVRVRFRARVRASFIELAVINRDQFLISMGVSLAL